MFENKYKKQLEHVMKKLKYHYFYKITNLVNGKFYYGVHNTDNLDDGYMGSGVALHKAFKKYGISNFKKEILKFFDTLEDAFKYEEKIVNKELTRLQECYNVIPGGKYFDTTGLATVKDSSGNCFDVSVDDPRYISGELVSVSTNRVTVIDENGNTKSVFKNDPKYIDGIYVPFTKGKVTVTDESGKHFYISLTDENYINGKYVSIRKNMVPAVDSSGNQTIVSIDDPRYISGELVHNWVGRKHTEETKNKIKKCHAETGYQKGEKNSQFGTCWVYNDEESIRIKKEELSEYISNGWKKGRKYTKSQLETLNKKREHLSDEQKKPSLGCMWISNDLLKKSTYIKKELLNEYIENGWKIGRRFYKNV